ncbi:MAG: IS110 family transposase [Thermoguttaceae bacterium]|nr:IS110 family transposase [Thermoguttaceae bacterium]
MKKSLPSRPVLAKGRAVVGIDVGKRKHAATALTLQGEVIARLASFPNTRQGVDQLEKEVLRKAGGPSKVLVGMEATGHYWMCLYHELTRRGYACVVLNPLQTNARSSARIRKTRTDKIDSETIARLILSGEAKATRVPDPKITELRLLVRHRHRLLCAAGDMERYAHTLVDRVFPEYADVFCKLFLSSSQKLIRQIGLAPGKLVERADEVRELLRRAGRGRIAPETIDQLLEAAKESIGTRQAEHLAESQLRSIFDHLETVRQQIAYIEKQLDERVQPLDSPLFSLGITSPLVAAIHAESDPIADFTSPEQYVAYAGLDPSLHDSGDTIQRRGKISKRGSPLLRHTLYLAAFVVYRRHDYFRRIYRKHRSRGKKHRNALVIVARRLARVIWRLLSDGRPFTARPPKAACPMAKPHKSRKSTRKAVCARA